MKHIYNSHLSLRAWSFHPSFILWHRVAGINPLVPYLTLLTSLVHSLSGLVWLPRLCATTPFLPRLSPRLLTRSTVERGEYFIGISIISIKFWNLNNLIAGEIKKTWQNQWKIQFNCGYWPLIIGDRCFRCETSGKQWPVTSLFFMSCPKIKTHKTNR